MNIKDQLIVGVLTVGLGMVILQNCRPSNSWGCPVYQIQNRLPDYNDLSTLGTQYSNPAYMSQILSFNRTFSSLGTIAQI